MSQTVSNTLEQFNHCVGALCITDLSGRLVYANKSIKECFGFCVAESVGKKPGELWGGNMTRQFYNYLWQKIEKNKEPFIGRVRNKTKVGKEKEDTTFIAPILDKFGKPQYYAALHPLLYSNEEKRRFTKEFGLYFSKQKSISSFSSWTYSWLARNGTNLCSSNKETIFSNWLETELIFPLAKKFTSRHEDGLLVLRAKENSEQFGKLYNKYVANIEAYFFGRVSCKTIAQDLTQETFLRAFAHIDNFTMQNANYQTYLIRIAHNLLVNYYKKKKAKLFSDESMLKSMGLDIAKKQSFEQGMVPLLWQAVERLSVIEQKVIILKYRHDESIKEIANQVGKTENAVKLHLVRARKKLRTFLVDK